jgi:hypothetical protein
VKWIFHLYAEMVDGLERGAQFLFDGRPYEFWRTTSTKNSKRAFARQYAEALGGRALEDKEVPKLHSLLDAKMSAMITYDPDPEDSSRQLLKMGGLKHVAPPQATASPSPAPAAKAASDIAWPDIDDDDVDRVLLVKKIRKSYERLKTLDPASAKGAKGAIQASDLNESLMEDLQTLSDQISAAVRVALEMDD